MVYNDDASSQLPPEVEPLGGVLRRSSRSKPIPPEQRMSLFYQQRERDDDDAFRTFYSVPVGMSEALREREPRVGRYMVHPLRLRDADCRPDPRLPDLSASAHDALDIASSLLRCYLPSDSVVEFSNPFGIYQCIDTRKYVCRDAQKAVANDGTPVHQLLINGLAGVIPELEAVDEVFEEESFHVLLVGAHLRPVDRLGKPRKDLDWVYSSPIEPGPDSDSAPWAISTFQIEAHLDHSEALRARVLCGQLLYCVLGNGVGVELCCESEPCAMNNCDSVGEMTCTSLLLCPCCLRKLQMFGVITDVPACLEKVHRVLSGPALRGVSTSDLNILHRWGHGRGGGAAAGSSSGAPIHVA